MSHEWGNVEVNLTVHYHGLKATQYFSKATPESESVLLADLLALKFPLPKRGNSDLISFGRMQCTWPSAQKGGTLHRHIKNRIEAIDNDHGSFQQTLMDLSISNITAKFIDLKTSHTTQTSFKRRFDRVDTSVDENPWKKQKTEVLPPAISPSNTTQSKQRTDANALGSKAPLHTVSHGTNPFNDKYPFVFSPSTPRHASAPSRPSTTDERTANAKQTDARTPTVILISQLNLYKSQAKRVATEFLKNIEIPKSWSNREQLPGWDTAKPPTNSLDKPPPSFAPAATQSSSTTQVSIWPTPSNASSTSTSTQPPRPSSVMSSQPPTASLPARPSSKLPPLSTSSAREPVRRLSRFGPAPAMHTQYSPHTLAAFAKDFTKIERISPGPLGPGPSPPSAPPRPSAVPFPTPTEPVSYPYSGSTFWTPPEAAAPAPSSVASTFSALKPAHTSKSSASDASDVRYIHDDARVPILEVPGLKLRGWPEEAPLARPARAFKETAAPSAPAPRYSKSKEEMGGVKNVEMRDVQRAALTPMSASTNPDVVRVDRKGSTGSGNGDGSSSAAKGDESALAELQERLAKVEAELMEERRRRRAAEDAIADIRRECRAPFIVPSLLDAFMELSRLTTMVTTIPRNIVQSDVNGKQPQQSIKNSVAVNGSAASQRQARVDTQASMSMPVRVKEEPVEIVWR